MIGYGDVLYNITAAYVARLQSDNTYLTPAPIEYIQQVSFEYDSDTDEIKSGGKILEKLAVPTQATGTISQADLAFAAWTAMTGFAHHEYGVTPNRYDITDVVVGGQGLPYVGLIVSYAAVNGAQMLCGFPKFMLDTVPGFTVDQNKFRVAESGFGAIAPSANYSSPVRYRKQETYGPIPTTAQGFLDFFTTPINMFA